MTIDGWIPGFKETRKNQNALYTKDELVQKLRDIQGRDWISVTEHRQDRDGGLGNTLEDLLGIPENNIPLADYGRFELKTHRSHSNSLITLFRFEPRPRSTVPTLVRNYGWPISKYGPKERSLRIDMDAASFSERGFIVRISEELERVEIHFDSSKVPREAPYSNWLRTVETRVGMGDLNPIPYWTYDDLAEKIQMKIKNMVYVTLDTRKHSMRIALALLLQGAGLQELLDGIRRGWLQVEFNARTHHNHGTAFRTWGRNWPKLYTNIEKLMD